MSRYRLPFSITPAILNLVVEVGELLGHRAAQTGCASPLLRKENRQASLGVTPRTAERYLNALQQKAKLQRVAPRKGGR